MRSWCLVLTAAFVMLTSFYTSAAAGWSGKSKVKSMYVLNETTALIKLESFQNPHNCKVNSVEISFLIHSPIKLGLPFYYLLKWRVRGGCIRKCKLWKNTLGRTNVCDYRTCSPFLTSPDSFCKS